MGVVILSVVPLVMVRGRPSAPLGVTVPEKMVLVRVTIVAGVEEIPVLTVRGLVGIGVIIAPVRGEIALHRISEVIKLKRRTSTPFLII